jgi:hypothetical membrane protein
VTPTPAANPPGRSARRDRLRHRLATIAMAGVVLYVLIDVVLQFLPPYYSPISDAESNLAVGPYGWIMNLNFLARAALSGCAIAALALSGGAGRLRTAGLVLFAIAGALSGLLAFFATDVVDHGQVDVAAQSSAALATTTATGAVHLAAATAGFLAALLAFAVLTLWLRNHAALRHVYRRALALLLLAVAGIVFLGVAIAVAPSVLGLAERICLVGILGWVFVVCGAVRTLPAA